VNKSSKKRAGLSKKFKPITNPDFACPNKKTSIPTKTSKKRHILLQKQKSSDATASGCTDGKYLQGSYGTCEVPPRVIRYGDVYEHSKPCAGGVGSLVFNIPSEAR
jgi:hypothetical protein